jgi:hypothetical protein
MHIFRTSTATASRCSVCYDASLFAVVVASSDLLLPASELLKCRVDRVAAAAATVAAALLLLLPLKVDAALATTRRQTNLRIMIIRY